MSLFLRAFLLALFSSLSSFLLGHWLLLRAFSHTQLNHYIKMVEVKNEVFGYARDKRFDVNTMLNVPYEVNIW